MIKRVIIFFTLVNAAVASADTLSGETLKVYGRALANYQLCSQIARSLGDPSMHNYYAEMFDDSAAEIAALPENQSNILFNEFKRSADKLARIDKQSMGQLCLSRFDLLSRKMQEKKLAGK